MQGTAPDTSNKSISNGFGKINFGSGWDVEVEMENLQFDNLNAPVPGGHHGNGNGPGGGNGSRRGSDHRDYATDNGTDRGYSVMGPGEASLSSASSNGRGTDGMRDPDVGSH